MPGDVFGFYVDLFQPYVQALEEFALLMDRTFRIPWPLVIAALYVPFLASLSLVVWWMRGAVWPLNCDYPTARRRTCKNRALGEWHRCHVHNARRLRWTDHHIIRPDLRRWETITNGSVVERADVYGRGLVLMKTERFSILHHRGFVRTPRNAFSVTPEVVRDHWQRSRSVLRDIRRLGVRALLVGPPTRTVLGVSPLVEHTIRATRLACLLVVVALGIVVISVLVRTPVKTVLEYGDEFVFIAALAAVRRIYSPGPRWLRHAGRDFVDWSVPWIIVVLYGAILTVGMSDLHALLRSGAAVLFFPVAAVVAILMSGKGRRRRA